MRIYLFYLLLWYFIERSYSRDTEDKEKPFLPKKILSNDPLQYHCLDRSEKVCLIALLNGNSAENVDQGLAILSEIHQKYINNTHFEYLWIDLECQSYLSLYLKVTHEKLPSLLFVFPRSSRFVVLDKDYTVENIMEFMDRIENKIGESKKYYDDDFWISPLSCEEQDNAKKIKIDDLDVKKVMDGMVKKAFNANVAELEKKVEEKIKEGKLDKKFEEEYLKELQKLKESTEKDQEEAQKETVQSVKSDL